MAHSLRSFARLNRGASPLELPTRFRLRAKRYLWEGGSGVTLVETYAEKATKAKGGTPTEHPVTATPKGKN